MKKIYYILTIMVAALASCQKDEPVAKQGDVTVFTASVPDTKISIQGNKSLWEASDAIVVNGQVSTKTTVTDGGAKATFEAPYVPAPYNLVAPANLYSNGKIVLPSTQNWTDGSYDKAAVALLAHSEGTTNITFSHAMTFIKLTVTGGDANIRSVNLSAANGENLSGEFTPDFSSLLLQGASTGKNVTLDCGTAGLAAGTVMYIAVPAQKYTGGLKLQITDVAGKCSFAATSGAFDAKAGAAYTMTTVFNPAGEGQIACIGPLNPYAVKKVLFIGNSHTLDATTYLPDLLRTENIRDIELTRVFHPGYYLVGYNNNYTLGDNCSVETWKPGQFRWRGNIVQDHNLKSIVESDVYDIVVLQEYTGSSYCYGSSAWATEKDAINGLISKIRKTSPDAEFVFFLSHCWADDYSGTVTTFGGSSTNQFNLCVENTLRHVMDPAEGLPFTKIISTAAMLQNLRTSGLNNDKSLLRGDGVHLDYGLSRVAAGYLIWKTLFTPLTNIQAQDLLFRLNEYYPQATKNTTPFTDAVLPTVRAAIDAAYEHPDQITDLSSYSTVPMYTHVPGSYGLDMENVDIEPVTFPVEFALGYKSGTGYLCSSNTQPYWTGNECFYATQQQALARWVMKDPQQFGAGIIPNWSFYNSLPSGSVRIQGAWTDDYMEFVIPVQNFRAGTTVSAYLPIYVSNAPCFWFLEYKDGDEWKSNHAATSTADNAYSRDASFVLVEGANEITMDMTFTKAVDSGYLRFRLRCADGAIQTTTDGYVERTQPYINGGAFAGEFYFHGGKSLSFSLI